MKKTILGRTNLEVTRSGFGALPIQRVSFEEARLLLRKAYDNGINFFDTARAYSDSEEKIGYSLSDVRKNIIICTKTNATNRKELFEQLETSLKKMKTDYIDVYQLHNPSEIPEEGSELYESLLEAKRQGKIRFIGITNHSVENGRKTIKSNLFDTLQFPFNILSSDKDLELIGMAKEHNIGLIGMKGMSGGLIKNSKAAFAFLRQFDNLVPIWGVQKEYELDEFLEYERTEPQLTCELEKEIEEDRKQLAGDFCRACGYCMPCSVGIEIPTAARMKLLLGRMPYQGFMSDEWYENMHLIEKCIECGKCVSKCPYKLNTPELLKKNLEYYKEFYNNYKNN